MSAYIEERPDAIAAIKKAIDEKWNPICYGYLGLTPDCALCEIAEAEEWDCRDCPLGRRYKVEEGCCCFKYRLWASRKGVLSVYGWTSRVEGYAPIQAEAMLEALVMLLPPEHRKEYGG